MQKYLGFFALVMLMTSKPVFSSDPTDMGLIKAQGFGVADTAKYPKPQARLLSRRAAMVDAQRNLVEIVDGVRVTAGTTVKDMTLESDIVGTRVKGMLQGAFVVEQKTYEEDGSFVSEVELAVCLNAAPVSCRQKPTLTALIQPTLTKPEPEAVFTPEDVVKKMMSDESASNSNAPNQQEEASASGGANTGLIVDVSGKSFAPMLDVRVQTDSGKELYGPAHVAPGSNWLNWSNSVDNARGMTDIVGDNPMVVSVENLGANSELIVSNDNASALFEANLASGDFLKAGKVIFVVN